MLRFLSDVPPSAADFSHIDTKQKAQHAFRAGQLELLFLTPLEFGGLDLPFNEIYVPAGLARLKHHIDFTIIGPAKDCGAVRRYSASPTYLGDSHVPTAIEVRAWDPDEIHRTVHLWGPPIR